jgi:hypothetical protein
MDDIRIVEAAPPDLHEVASMCHLLWPSGLWQKSVSNSGASRLSRLPQ